MEKLKVNFVLDHSQFFQPTTHYVGVGWSYKEALYDLERLVWEDDQDVELEQVDDDYIVAYDVAVNRTKNEISYLHATLIKESELLPLIKESEDDELQAIIACESDVQLLNISEALKAELINTLEYSEVAVFAELVEV